MMMRTDLLAWRFWFVIGTQVLTLLACTNGGINVSSMGSSTILALPTATSTPEQPFTLVVTGRVELANKVYLEWNSNPLATKYEVWRKDETTNPPDTDTNSKEWLKLGEITIAENATHYLDSAVTAGNSYSYKILSLDSLGNSSSSEPITLTAMGPSLQPNLSFGTEVTGAPNLTITWNPVSGVDHYHVKWGVNKTNLDNIDADTIADSISFTLPISNDPLPTTLKYRTVYFIQVVAENANGEIRSDIQSVFTGYENVLDTKFANNGIWKTAGNVDGLAEEARTIDFDLDGHVYTAGKLVDSALNAFVAKLHSGASTTDPQHSTQDDYTIKQYIGPSAGINVLSVLKNLGEVLMGGFLGASAQLLGISATPTQIYPIVNDLKANTFQRIVRLLNAKHPTTNANVTYACITEVDAGGASIFSTSNRVLRYQYDWTLDPSWGTGGILEISNLMTAGNGIHSVDCAIDRENRIYVLSEGVFSAGIPNQMLLTRLTSSGTIDTTFGRDTPGQVHWDDGSPTLNELPQRLLIFRQGDIDKPLVITNIFDINFPLIKMNPALILFKVDGQLDTQFANGGVWSTMNIASLTLNGNYSEFKSAVFHPTDPDSLYLTGWSFDEINGRDMAIWKFDMANGSSEAQMDFSFSADGVWTHHNAAGGNGNDVGLDIGISPVDYMIYVAGRSIRSKTYSIKYDSKGNTISTNQDSDSDAIVWGLK